MAGGHSMKDDNQTGTITGLSKCWDGDAYQRIRAGGGNSIIAGKRLDLHLMMQPIVSESLRFYNKAWVGTSVISEISRACG